MERRVRRAAQCAFAIQEFLHNCELAQEVRLSVKIGIGMGKVGATDEGVERLCDWRDASTAMASAFDARWHERGVPEKCLESLRRPWSGLNSG